MKVKVESLRPVQLFATPWTVAWQAPLSMGFPRQEYWSGPPFPSPDPPLYINTYITVTGYLMMASRQWTGYDRNAPFITIMLRNTYQE